MYRTEEDSRERTVRSILSFRYIYINATQSNKYNYYLEKKVGHKINKNSIRDAHGHTN